MYIRSSELINGSDILFHRAKIADSFWSRFKGLMLVKEISEEQALIFNNCNSIHMFFMKMDIDGVFLDKSGKIIALKSLYRHKLYKVSKAYTVVECKLGSIQRLNIQLGGFLSWQEK